MNVDMWLSLIDRIMWFVLIVSAFFLVGIAAARLALFVVDLLKGALIY